MTVSRTRWSLTGAVWAALILAPALCSAQPPGETGPNGGSNPTRQTQNAVHLLMHRPVPSDQNHHLTARLTGQQSHR
jgi:hypothetical protein